MKKLKVIGFLALLCASLLVQAQSMGVEGQVLGKIRRSQVVNVGVQDQNQPFSYFDEANNAKGYAVELCSNIIDGIRRQLNAPGIKINYVRVATGERIAKLSTGEVDMLCGASTITKARLQQIAFSDAYFVAGMRFLTGKQRRIDSLSDLKGLKVAVIKGGTAEKLLGGMLQNSQKDTLVSFVEVAAAYDALKNNEVQAIAHDDVILLNLASLDKALDKWELANWALSVEPFGIMLPKNNQDWVNLIDQNLRLIYASGGIHSIYDHWFNNNNLQYPLNRLTKESFVRPNKQPGVAMELGYEL